MKKNILISLIVILSISILSVLFYFVCPKFKDVTISIVDNSLSMDDFVTFNLFKNNSKILNNKDIKLGNVSVQNVMLSFNDKKYNVKLNIVDDVKPNVKFKNMSVFLGDKVDKNDFIVEVFDHSKYEITFDDSNVDYNKIGTYNVLVSVKDEYGNVKEKECTLFVKLFNDVIYHEIGNEFKIEQLYFDNNEINIENLNISNLNVNKVGSYSISFYIDGTLYNSKVNVSDNVGPIINSTELVLYENDINFDKSELLDVSDYSLNFYYVKGDFSTLQLGENKVFINAIDVYGNSSYKETNILVKNDNVGPVISGTKNITIARGSEIDLLSGIESVDKSDGKCEVTYNKDKINISKVGTYDLVYSSYDKSRNLSQKKVVLKVIPDKEEVDRLFQEFYDKYLKGKNTLGMTKVIREKIKYKNVRGIDPVWTGLSTMSGSCFVHAEMLHKALDIAGIENYVIVAKGNTHSWVIAKENEKWRHYDPTPGKHDIGPLTDSEKTYAPGLGYLYWDRTKYPKAE